MRIAVVGARGQLGAAVVGEFLASHEVIALGRADLDITEGMFGLPEPVGALLGPTGNLRAPALRVGKTLLVGFSEEVYREQLL